MYKILLIFMSFGVIFLFGCTSATQSSVQGNDQLHSGGKNLAQMDETDIKTLQDGTKYLLHPNNILSGGPPKDGIPSLDNPKFQNAEEADRWLNEEDLVLGLSYKGVSRAYPHRVLNWHEIVNDKVGGERILITYCPLCRTGIAFKPIVNGQEVEFGTSGKLYNSELVMYDRLTDSYWPQTLGKAVIGQATPQVLEKIPLDTVRWGDWKKVHPDTQVLRKETGFIRDYDRNPYADFQKNDIVGFGLEFNDVRLKPKEIVYGAEIEGIAKAYPEDELRRNEIINDELDGIPIVAAWYEELNTGRIFNSNLDGEILTFQITDNKIIDQTGREWTIQEMIANLETLDTFGHFWFAWAAFFPNTEVYGK
jgi:hypothetical protein